MKEKDKELVAEFKRRIPLDLARHMRKLIVFGSRVKEEATEDSDLDIIVLVDERAPEIEKNLEDIAYQVMWDYDFRPIISLKVFAESQFYNAINKGYSFYRNIEKEGVSV
jgi:predicted nucleotidyltransferase